MPDYIVFKVIDFQGGSFKKTLHPMGRATETSPALALKSVLGNSSEQGSFRVIDEGFISKFNVTIEPKGAVDPTPTPPDEV